MTPTSEKKRRPRKESLIAPGPFQFSTLLAGGDGVPKRPKRPPEDILFGPEPAPLSQRSRLNAVPTASFLDPRADILFGASRPTETKKQTETGSNTGLTQDRKIDTNSGRHLSRPPGAGGRPPEKPPIVNKEGDRIQSVIFDTPAQFEILDDSKADGSPPFYAVHSVGRDAVLENDQIIERETKRQGVDPDLVRAIMYVENAQGYYDVLLSPIRGKASIRPMNIKESVWSGLLKSGETLRDPETNIRVGVTLIKRLSERVENPNARKIAPIWIYAGTEHTNNRNVSDYAARVARVLQEKPWLKKGKVDTDVDDDTRFFLGP